MITEENINKIYQAIINNIPLTTKELNSYGLNSKDLKKLREEQIIKNIKRGEYELVSIDDLYNYGLILLSKDESTKALYCFDRCIELAPNHLPSLYQKLYFYLQKQEYQQLYKILDKLRENIDLKTQSSYNLYLFLLSYITELPSNYQEQVLSMSKFDLTIKTEYTDLEKTITENIYNAKLSKARYYLNILNENEPSNGIERNIINELLSRAIENEKRISNKLLSLVKEERYRDIEIILEKKIKTRKCKQSDEYCLLLSRIIQKILRTKEIPSILNTNLNTKNFYHAIDDNNFELAEKLNNEYLKTINQDNDTLFSILLRKINQLINDINNIKNEEIINEENIEQVNLDKNNNGLTKKDLSVSTEKQEYINFTDILIELLNNNIEKFNELLKKYLIQNDMQEYEYLIVNLNKLSIIENDRTFIKPIKILTEIDKKIYQFDISLYIKEYYSSISLNNLEVAKIYLDIISRYSQESKEVITILTDTLEKAKHQMNKQQNILSNELITDNKPITGVNQNIVSETKEESNKNEISKTLVKIDSLIEERKINESSTLQEEYELITKIIQDMKNNKITISVLKNISWERRKKIHQIIGEFEELLSYGIGLEPKTIILRITDSKQERIVFKEELDDFFKAHKYKEYDLCIEIGNKLLKDKHFNPMKHKDSRKIFDILGQSYLRTKDIPNTITYLTIVNELNNESEKKLDKFDYTDILEELTNSQIINRETQGQNNNQSLSDTSENSDTSSISSKKAFNPLPNPLVAIFPSYFLFLLLLINSLASFLYVLAPLDNGSYTVIGNP